MAEGDQTAAMQLVENVLVWEGVDDDAGPERWVNEHADQIQTEAITGDVGVIGTALDLIVSMSEGDDPGGAFAALTGLIGSLGHAAQVVTHKFWGYLSAGARRVHGMWNPLIVLVHRYWGKLQAIAHRLHATGFSIGVNIPFGISLALNFDFGPGSP
jgi:hypothetical protein